MSYDVLELEIQIDCARKHKYSSCFLYLSYDILLVSETNSDANSRTYRLQKTASKFQIYNLFIFGLLTGKYHDTYD